jgi:hypothetical protein
MKKNFQISLGALSRVHRKLKAMEKTDPKLAIGGMKPSHFLVANTRLSDASESVDLRVKAILLQIQGDYTTSPADLPDKANLQTNLEFGDDEMSLLQIRLDTLVKEYKKGAAISDNDVSGCTTVGDVVDLVKSKIK